MKYILLKLPHKNIMGIPRMIKKGHVFRNL